MIFVGTGTLQANEPFSPEMTGSVRSAQGTALPRRGNYNWREIIMNKFRRTLAGLFAVCLCASGVNLPAADKAPQLIAGAADGDLTSKMEWGTLKIGGGGFVSGIVTGKKTMYARTDVGGAYRFNYKTDSWEQLLGFINEDDRGLLSVDAMAIDPTNEDTVYFLCLLLLRKDRHLQDHGRRQDLHYVRCYRYDSGTRQRQRQTDRRIHRC